MGIDLVPLPVYVHVYALVKSGEDAEHASHTEVAAQLFTSLHPTLEGALKEASGTGGMVFKVNASDLQEMQLWTDTYDDGSHGMHLGGGYHWPNPKPVRNEINTALVIEELPHEYST